MILYIILEFVMIVLSLIHLKAIFSKEETKLFNDRYMPIYWFHINNYIYILLVCYN